MSARSMQPFREFPFDKANRIFRELIEQAYSAQGFAPSTSPQPELPGATAGGVESLKRCLQALVTGASGLSSGGAMGHMDTAPHPAAAFADALVSATNNNLLFRELSPFASQVEEQMLDFLADGLGLVSDWHGTFCSGGSLANLTALFAAAGGFKDVANRDTYRWVVPECAHTSIHKALALLGVKTQNISVLSGDAMGRVEADKVREALLSHSAHPCIVVAVAGSTVHGAVEDIDGIAAVCREQNAWLHVDAVHGGAVGFSHSFRHLLDGLNKADSVSFGPQKWMYTPRLCAVVWVRQQQRFNDALAMALPYSDGDAHRGSWGLQGSRRADVLTLWAVLHYVGTDALASEVDRSIAVAQYTAAELCARGDVDCPMPLNMNLICFRPKRVSDDWMRHRHQQLTHSADWLSLSAWQGQLWFRVVILSPDTDEQRLRQLIDQVLSD